MKHCSRCIFAGETYLEPDEAFEDDDGLYECTWNVVVPYTWRYCLRERMSARGNDALQCECFQEKEEK